MTSKPDRWTITVKRDGSVLAEGERTLAKADSAGPIRTRLLPRMFDNEERALRWVSEERGITYTINRIPKG